MKAWGNPSYQPILVTHSLMDNAASFDKLIPLLPQSYYYISIDFPSHGKSSHFPPFFPVHFYNFIVVCKIVLDYFKREKYILLGHGYGAGIAKYFARFYPQYVEKLIGIDTITPYVPTETFKEHFKTIFSESIALMEQHNEGYRQSYTKLEAMEKVRTDRYGEPLTLEASRSLLNRTLQPAGMYSL